MNALLSTVPLIGIQDRVLFQRHSARDFLYSCLFKLILNPSLFDFELLGISRIFKIIYLRIICKIT